MFNYVLLLIISLFFPLLSKQEVFAATTQKYVTIVNPVRDRSFWQNSQSVLRQIELLLEHKLPATWLLQYSAFTDPYVVKIFNQLTPDHELGIFLEVDEKLANDSFVPYLYGEGDRARADKVLLSGYTPSERKRMITLIFNKFKNTFGSYPTAVGGWYIDTVSLNFMVDKYKIKTILDVSDQYQTDTYGVWGKPWGVPYYPSRLNSLVPAQTTQNKLPIVKIQWAQRDPVRGYGLTTLASTFSLQANDYISHHNLKTDYFRQLCQTYLNSNNSLSQVTIGLEVGQEGASFLDEYKNQILTLVNWHDNGELNFTTMTDFATKYRTSYPDVSANFITHGFDYENPKVQALWFSTPFYRVGFVVEKNILRIRDLRLYDEFFLFNDIFEQDKNKQLKRIITSLIDELSSQNSIVLISDTKDIKIVRQDKGILITVTDNLNKVYEVKLEQQNILINKKPLLETEDKNNSRNLLRRLIARLIVDYQVKNVYDWKPSIRYSDIGNVSYFGLWVSPDKLLGVTSSRPYIGLFEFPFQVLSRFKTIPTVDGMMLFSKHFIKNYKPSTIYIKI